MLTAAQPAWFDASSSPSRPRPLALSPFPSPSPPRLRSAHHSVHAGHFDPVRLRCGAGRPACVPARAAFTHLCYTRPKFTGSPGHPSSHKRGRRCRQGMESTRGDAEVGVLQREERSRVREASSPRRKSEWPANLQFGNFRGSLLSWGEGSAGVTGEWPSAACCSTCMCWWPSANLDVADGRPGASYFRRTWRWCPCACSS